MEADARTCLQLIIGRFHRTSQVLILSAVHPHSFGFAVFRELEQNISMLVLSTYTQTRDVSDERCDRREA